MTRWGEFPEPRQRRLSYAPLPQLPQQALGLRNARADWGSGGEAGARHVLEAWCVMASTGSSEQALSEVQFLTVAEVAGRMRVSKMTVYRLVHSGELPAVRVGRSFRVPEDAVNEYLRKSYYQAG